MIKRMLYFAAATMLVLGCQDASAPVSLDEAQIDGLSTAAPQAQNDATLSAFGTATIDGVVGTGEWDGADMVSVFGGPFAGSVFYVMNDADNLYLLLEVVDATLTGDDLMVVRFDNGNNEVTDQNDDKLTVGESQFEDGHFETDWSAVDTQQDGSGTATGDGTTNYFELSHPLNSGDAEDFSLAVGDLVGFCLRYFDAGTATTDSHYPTDCELAANEQTLYAEIRIAEPVVSVVIDIKPGSAENPINLKSNGVIPVAILGSADFDVNDIDRSTVVFGPAEAGPAHSAGGHLEDADEDGLMDLVVHFRTQETGLNVGDTEACVSGALMGGQAFEGCDVVRVKG